MAAKNPPRPPDAPHAVAQTGESTGGSLFGDAPSAGGPRAYQVLARKYRPRTFADLVGQEAMVRTLSNAFRTGRIAHAFMLTGVRGVGKTTTARLLARALNYKSATVDAPSIDLDPPGIHCAAIMASSHPDVLELDAASRTGVQDMRDLLDGARYAPVSARYKVYIIDEVHMLSTAAFNALLKTLEEPPPHVKFIFATTEIRRVPVTVLSRCQRFNLQRFSTEALTAHLGHIARQEGVRIDPEALALIARAAEGSARDGLSILDQAIVRAAGDSAAAGDAAPLVPAEMVREMLGLADRSRVLDLLEKCIASDHRGALEEATGLMTAGADAATLIKDLLDAATDLAEAQALGDAWRYAGPADWGTRTRAMAARISPAQAARIWRILLQGIDDCAKAPEPETAARMVALRLAAVAALPAPEDAARLLAERAERGGPPPGGAPGGGGGRGQRETAVQAHFEGADRAGYAAHDHGEGGLVLSNLAQIRAALSEARQIDLLYEIEQFVRPAAVGYGQFHFASAPGAPADLPLKLKRWLENASGVEWEVAETGGAGAARETAAEIRRRRKQERLDAAAAHPRIAEALRLFPGAKIIAVEGPETETDDDEAFDETRGENVVRVDFARRGLADEETDVEEQATSDDVGGPDAAEMANEPLYPDDGRPVGEDEEDDA